MASPSYTYTLTNGTTADASQVTQNFTDILNGVTDGTKDLSINALTCAGTATLNGHVNLGNASADDLTITASLASSIPIKTNNSFDIGTATLGIRKFYLGNGGIGATCDIVAASHAVTREYTVPDCSAAATFVMTEIAQSINGAKTFNSGVAFGGGGTNLNYYNSGTTALTFAFNGAGSTTSTVTAKFVRVGEWVTLSFLGMAGNTGIGSTNFSTNTPLTNWARPEANTKIITQFIKSGAANGTPGMIFLATTGSMTIHADPSTINGFGTSEINTGLDSNAIFTMIYRGA